MNAETQEEQQALDDFRAGFDGTNEPPSDAAKNEQGDEQAQEQEVSTPEPEYVQLTRQQFDEWQSRLSEIDNLKTAYAKTSGSLGSLNQVIERLQANTPKGQPVELTAEDVADITNEFGEEFGAAQLKVLRNVVGKLHGSGAPQFDAAQIDATVQSKIAEASTSMRSEVATEIRMEMLSDIHPDWMEIRDTQDFRDWMAALPQDDAKKMNETNSVSYLAGKFTEFKKSLERKNQPAAPEKPNAKAEARREQMQAAVQPKGESGHREGGNTALDDFHAGFYGDTKRK